MAIVKLSEQLPAKARRMIADLERIAAELARDGHIVAANRCDNAARQISMAYKGAAHG